MNIRFAVVFALVLLVLIDHGAARKKKAVKKKGIKLRGDRPKQALQRQKQLLNVMKEQTKKIKAARKQARQDLKEQRQATPSRQERLDEMNVKFKEEVQTMLDSITEQYNSGVFDLAEYYHEDVTVMAQGVPTAVGLTATEALLNQQRAVVDNARNIAIAEAFVVTNNKGLVIYTSQCFNGDTYIADYRSFAYLERAKDENKEDDEKPNWKIKIISLNSFLAAPETDAESDSGVEP